MTDQQIKTFAKKVRIEKCDGKLTIVKLAEFISNYNSKNLKFSIFIEHASSMNGNIIIVNRFTKQEESKGWFTTLEGKLQSMLYGMLYVIENSEDDAFTFYWEV